MEFATPRTADSTLNADHDDDLVARYQRMEDLLGGGEPPGLAACELEEEVDEQDVESGGHATGTLSHRGSNRSSNNKADIYHRAWGRLLDK